MHKNLVQSFVKHLLIYVAVVGIFYNVLLSSSMAGGLEPVPDLQKAVNKVRSLYVGENLSFLADTEYKVHKYYYQIQSKTQKLEILDEVKGHFEKAVTKAEEKYDEGEDDISQSSITKLKLGLASTLNDIIQLKSEEKIAWLSLASVLKDDSFPEREMLESVIVPVEFKFDRNNH